MARINHQELLRILMDDHQGYWFPLSKQFTRQQLEKRYQTKIKGFSPAYLAGSSWYVGPSLTEYLDSIPIHKGVLCGLMWLSNKA